MMCKDFEDAVTDALSGVIPDPTLVDLGMGTDQASFADEWIREAELASYGFEIPPVLLSLTPDAISEEDL